MTVAYAGPPINSGEIASQIESGATQNYLASQQASAYDAAKQSMAKVYGPDTANMVFGNPTGFEQANQGQYRNALAMQATAEAQHQQAMTPGQVTGQGIQNDTSSFNLSQSKLSADQQAHIRMIDSLRGVAKPDGSITPEDFDATIGDHAATYNIPPDQIEALKARASMPGGSKILDAIETGLRAQTPQAGPLMNNGNGLVPTRTNSVTQAIELAPNPQGLTVAPPMQGGTKVYKDSAGASHTYSFDKYGQAYEGGKFVGSVPGDQKLVSDYLGEERNATTEESVGVRREALVANIEDRLTKNDIAGARAAIQKYRAATAANNTTFGAGDVALPNIPGQPGTPAPPGTPAVPQPVPAAGPAPEGAPAPQPATAPQGGATAPQATPAKPPAGASPLWRGDLKPVNVTAKGQQTLSNSALQVAGVKTNLDNSDLVVNQMKRQITPGAVGSIAATWNARIPGSVRTNLDANAATLRAQAAQMVISASKNQQGSTGFGRILQSEYKNFTTMYGNLEGDQTFGQYVTHLNMLQQSLHRMYEAQYQNFQQSWGRNPEDVINPRTSVTGKPQLTEGQTGVDKATGRKVIVKGGQVVFQ